MNLKVGGIYSGPEDTVNIILVDMKTKYYICQLKSLEYRNSVFQFMIHSILVDWRNYQDRVEFTSLSKDLDSIDFGYLGQLESQLVEKLKKKAFCL